VIAPHRQPVAACAMVVLLSTCAGRAAAASLPEARELYAAAAYGDALTMLDALVNASPAPGERQSLDLYRMLCLVALGRRAEADRALESMIQRDPFYHPTSEDVPPRMRAAFTDARKRLLPLIVQQQYANAKHAYDRKEFRAAGDAFAHVLKVLAHPDIGAEAAQPPLADLRTLAEGFRDLSRKASEPAPRPAAEAPVAGRIYTAEDRGVVPPTVIKQQVPRFRGRAAGPAEGVIEVVINARGAVESARMTTPLHAHYDSQVVVAARDWKYRPATLNGTPVKFRKQVRVTLVVTSPES
jgi:tetratricopeptide (TPR) repeat protein